MCSEEVSHESLHVLLTFTYRDELEKTICVASKGYSQTKKKKLSITIASVSYLKLFSSQSDSVLLSFSLSSEQFV